MAQARAEWSTWHVGLVTLQAALRGRLTLYEPTGPAVPAVPWRDGLDPPRRVLRAGSRNDEGERRAATHKVRHAGR
jgi:hypothetical protein